MGTSAAQVLFFAGQVAALAFLAYGGWLCLVATRERPVILVVDDDPSMRALVRRHLAKCGCDVLEAADGIAGRHLARAASPVLVISDVHMPRMSGLELLAALKSDPATRDIPVMLLTCDDDAESRARAAGVAGCLGKPFASAALLRAAEACTGRPLGAKPRGPTAGAAARS
jgi:CheY-like chemotaxis protein